MLIAGGWESARNESRAAMKRLRNSKSDVNPWDSFLSCTLSPAYIFSNWELLLTITKNNNEDQKTPQNQTTLLKLSRQSNAYVPFDGHF